MLTCIVPRKNILVAAGLSVFLFLIYNLNFRLISSGDALPAKLLPVSILVDGNFYLDRFYSLKERPDGYGLTSSRSGHLVSVYPVVAPILAVPIYAGPIVFLKSRHNSYQSTRFRWLLDCLEKISASLITALSAFFIFWILVEYAPMVWAIILTLVYGLCTNTWAISSQGLWQHGPAELLLCISLYAAIKLPVSSRWIYPLAISSALSFANRPINVIFTIAFLVYVSLIYHRLIFRYLLCVAMVGLALITYNLFAFGQPFGGYYVVLPSTLLHSQDPFYLRLLAMLFSPSRGLLIFSPILALGFWGIFRSWKQHPVTNKDVLLRILGLSSLSIILILSSMFKWWGGWCYGPRFLTDIIPILIFGMVNIISKFKPASRIIFILLVIWSALIQFVGAFYYPNRTWDSFPVSVDVSPQRVWDLKDNQILRSFRAGMLVPTLLEQGKVLFFPPQKLSQEGYKVGFDKPSFPNTMRCGHLASGILKVVNLSKFTWPSYADTLGFHVVRAAYHWRDVVTDSFVVFDGWRTALPRDLSPGSSVDLRMNIEPPSVPGRYILDISLVQEGDAWFEEMGASTLRLPITVFTDK